MVERSGVHPRLHLTHHVTVNTLTSTTLIITLASLTTTNHCHHPHYHSTLAWSPHHTKDITILGVQCRRTKIIPSLCDKFYEERLGTLMCCLLRNVASKKN